MEVIVPIVLLVFVFAEAVSNVIPPTDYLKCRFGRLRGSTVECNPSFPEATCPSGFLCSGGPHGQGGPCCVQTNPCNQGEPLLDADGEAVKCQKDEQCPTGSSCLTGINNTFTVCCPGIYPLSMYFISLHPEMLDKDIKLEKKIRSFVKTSSFSGKENVHGKQGEFLAQNHKVTSGSSQDDILGMENSNKPRPPADEFLRKNPSLPNLKIYEQPVVVSSAEIRDLPMCEFVACLAVHTSKYNKTCWRNSTMIENGRKCIGCPVNLCENPEICPSLKHCKDVSHLEPKCQQTTVIEHNGVLCPGCINKICGKAECVRKNCQRLPDFVPRQCIKRVQTTKTGDKICNNCFENTCLEKDSTLEYCLQAQCSKLPVIVQKQCIRFPVVSIGGKKCLGCPDDTCGKSRSFRFKLI